MMTKEFHQSNDLLAPVAADEHAAVGFFAAPGSEAFMAQLPWGQGDEKLVIELPQAAHGSIEHPAPEAEPEVEPPEEENHSDHAEEAPGAAVSELATSGEFQGLELANAIHALFSDHGPDNTTDDESPHGPANDLEHGLELAETLPPMGLPDMPEQVHGHVPFIS